MASKVDLGLDGSVKRGDTITINFTCLLDGVAVNITNAQKIWCTLKKHQEDVDPGFAQVTLLGGGISITDGPNGKCTATFAPTDTSSLTTTTTLFYDLQVLHQDGKLKTHVEGKLQVSVDITQAVS